MTDKPPSRAAYVLLAYPYAVDDMKHAIYGPFAKVTLADAWARSLGITSWCVRPLFAPHNEPTETDHSGAKRVP